MEQASLELNLNLKKDAQARVPGAGGARGSLGCAGRACCAVLPCEGRTGRPPFALETMLRVHFLQQWFSLSEPAMEEAFFDVPPTPEVI